MPLIPITYDQPYFMGDHGGPGYSDYASELTYLRERPAMLAANLVNGAALTGKTVLIVGCAYGFTVQALRAAGVSAWGMDISTWAISQTPANTAAFTMVGDARVESVYVAAKSLAKIRGQGTFDVIVTEDMLCCLTDAEAVAASVLMHKYGKVVAHLCDQDAHLATWYNWHPNSEQKNLLPADRFYSRFDWVVT